MRESPRDRRLRSVAARVGQDSGRSAPCVQPNTPDGHHRENVRSARDVLPRSVQFSVATNVRFSVAIDRSQCHAGLSPRTASEAAPPTDERRRLSFASRSFSHSPAMRGLDISASHQTCFKRHDVTHRRRLAHLTERQGRYGTIPATLPWGPTRSLVASRLDDVVLVVIVTVTYRVARRPFGTARRPVPSGL